MLKVQLAGGLRRRRTRSLEEFQEELSLPGDPHRIECYDNSNIQGTSPVSSMVVFERWQAGEQPVPPVQGEDRRGRGRLRDDGGDHAAALPAFGDAII